MEAGSALCRRGGLASRSCPHFEKSSFNVNRTSLGTPVCCCRAKMCSKIGSSLTRLSFTEHSHQTRGSGNSLRPFCPSSRPGMLSFTNRLLLFIPSLGRVRRPCRGLEKFFPPVLQRCYGCSFHAQEIVHTSHGMLGYYCFVFFFLLERKVPAHSKLKE